MLTLRLTVDQAIILRDALMLLRQQSPPESRSPIQEILDSVNVYLTLKLMKGIERGEYYEKGR